MSARISPVCGFSTITVPAMALVCFHAALEFAFGDGLNILIDGEDEIVAGRRLLLHAREPALAGVDGDHQLAGLALQFVS